MAAADRGSPKDCSPPPSDVTKLAGVVVVGALVVILAAGWHLSWPEWVLPLVGVWVGLVVLPAWAHLAIYFWRIRLRFKDYGVEPQGVTKKDGLPDGAGARKHNETDGNGNGG